MSYLNLGITILALLFILFVMSILYVLIYAKKDICKDTTLEYRNKRLVEVER